MRPAVLFPLFADITSLKGVGPRMAELYRRLTGPHVVDLLWHVPTGLIDRRYSPALKYADKDRVVTLRLTIAEHAPPRNKSQPYRIVGVDAAGDQVTITYFNAKGEYLASLYPTDRPVIVSGLLERYHGGWTINHPDYVASEQDADKIPALEPVYSLTAGISNKLLRKAAQNALQRAPDLAEWHDPTLQQREGWPSWRMALETLHNPTTDNLAITDKARHRLAYDELLADQLALAVVRQHQQKLPGRAMPGSGQLRQKLEQSLPFTLTGAQRQALAEIGADMVAPHRMLRLLQGDVGSGKTIVALIAMLQAAESGFQAALMAPTEILAKQHHKRLQECLQPLGIEIGLLVGKGRGVDRADTLRRLADGSLLLVVGTHALFQDGVTYAKLGLAVVDEQHRFGVQQRLQLSNKGKGADILVMTATPIPRTLTLTAYGDMDVSRLSDKPAGRKPIDTRLVDLIRLDEVVAGVKRQIATGTQVYWVCPLVEESEKIDLANATERASFLQRMLGDASRSSSPLEGEARRGGDPQNSKSELSANGTPPSLTLPSGGRESVPTAASTVGLIHGKMAPEEKDAIMAAFAAGQIKVLVATTVIEVGVDVPNASLMIIEHAERFGLAQLHQLRGRVGRGSAQSTCLMLYQSPLSLTARSRLTMMRETEDGFRIAEEDLKLRGGGELLGTRQSGLPEYRLSNLVNDSGLLDIAHDDAKLILHRDAELKTPRGEALRTLLYLFEKDAAVKLLRAG
jgi:ATP-dependent DNA helicase RecG